MPTEPSGRSETLSLISLLRIQPATLASAQDSALDSMIPARRDGLGGRDGRCFQSDPKARRHALGRILASQRSEKMAASPRAFFIASFEGRIQSCRWRSRQSKHSRERRRLIDPSRGFTYRPVVHSVSCLHVRSHRIQYPYVKSNMPWRAALPCLVARWRDWVNNAGAVIC